MFSSITALFEMIKSYFNLKEKKTDKQLESSTTKDQKNLKNACKIAMNIIDLVDNHGYFDTLSNQDRFNKWAKQFREKVI